MLHFTLSVIWFLLPAAAANMAPVFAGQLFPQWDTPVDLGRRFGSFRLFGSHKTYRGILAGIVAGWIVFVIQKGFALESEFLYHLGLFDYPETSSLFGAALGAGAVLGDLLKSFFKRRLGLAPGEPWIPYDQIDWVVGAVVVSYFVFSPDLLVIIASLSLGLILQASGKIIGFYLKVNSTPI